jgi:hypothetical protein
LAARDLGAVGSTDGALNFAGEQRLGRVDVERVFLSAGALDLYRDHRGGK